MGSAGRCALRSIEQNAWAAPYIENGQVDEEGNNVKG